MVGRRSSRRARTSELASVLTALGQLWADRPTLQIELLPSAPLGVRVTRDPEVNVISLAGRRTTARREVAQAS